MQPRVAFLLTSKIPSCAHSHSNNANNYRTGECVTTLIANNIAATSDKGVIIVSSAISPILSASDGSPPKKTTLEERPSLDRSRPYGLSDVFLARCAGSMFVADVR